MDCLSLPCWVELVVSGQGKNRPKQPGMSLCMSMCIFKRDSAQQKGNRRSYPTAESSPQAPPQGESQMLPNSTPSGCFSSMYTNKKGMTATKLELPCWFPWAPGVGLEGVTGRKPEPGFYRERSRGSESHTAAHWLHGVG